MPSFRTAIIGTGGRAHAYARQIAAWPDRFQLVAIADLNPVKCSAFGDTYGVPPAHRYSSHAELLAAEKGLDLAIITTHDTAHYETGMAAIKAGLNVLLEKPMAHTPAHARELLEAERSQGKLFAIGFVLRYTPFYQKVKEIVDSGVLGQLLTLEAKEILSHTHTARSFMRGHYRLRADSGSFILTKCSHDFDILNWLIGSRAVRVASLGGLRYFTPRPDVPQWCSDGCSLADTCIFYGPRVHGEAYRAKDQSTDRCVFNSEKDNVDHQHAIVAYANSFHASFSVVTLGAYERREIRISGTEAELVGDMAKREIRVSTYDPPSETVYRVSQMSGHGGGDAGLLGDVYRNLVAGTRNPLASAEAGYEAVVVACGADKSMLEGRPIELDSLRAERLKRQVVV
jgi:predicted dehydrogenase